ncbi:hypothetical protein ACFL59_08830 [Planctomycetota bacterium]
MSDYPLNLLEALGAADSSSQVLSVYVPNKDKNGAEIGNQRQWVLEAAELLAKLGGGVTVMPAVEGGWLADDGKVVWENPVVVYSWIKPEPFLAHVDDLREFLHRMGRETRQGEVGLEFNQRFYRIRTFDPA